MTSLQLAPSIVAFVLLGAHFLRSESYAALVLQRRRACAHFGFDAGAADRT